MNRSSTLLLSLFFCCCGITVAQEQNGWTILYYAAGSNSSEVDMLDDMQEMMQGKTSEGYEIIALVDRIEGHSEDATTLGDNFTDTRLYRFGNGTYTELEGKELLPQLQTETTYEANMGDATLLKRFIQYGKKYYPAKHYMLVLRSHGNGVSMCPDIESGVTDRLYPGELSDVLTVEESVDILGLDVCSMAGLENFYEWRPGDNKFSADYILASAPLSAAWDYTALFERLQREGGTRDQDNYFDEGKEQQLNPLTMTPLEFSKLIMEEIYDSQRWASWGLFDNTQITKVKTATDVLAVQLAKEDSNGIYAMIPNVLGYHHNTSTDDEVAKLAFPYIDAYDFAKKICDNIDLQIDTKQKASDLMKAIDALVIHSYYGNGFLPPNDQFTNGQYGAYLILPEGRRTFSQSGNSFWQHASWYTPLDQRTVDDAYGLYDWCIDGATAGNKTVENFYEYLDFLFDGKKDTNGYQW